MSAKQQKGNGFMSFVKSIITDKVKFSKNNTSGGDASKKEVQQVQAKEEQFNDLALIQAIQQEPSSGSKSKEVVTLRGASGLGYQATQAELESATQIQRLKNQIRQQEKDKEELATDVKLYESEERHVSVKKMQGDIKQQMIDQKQEKKRDKKQRQKTKKEDETAKKEAAETVKEVKPEPIREEREERPSRYENTERVRIRTKTRSRQKNKKRDNRPIEVKRAKLAERGIII